MYVNEGPKELLMQISLNKDPENQTALVVSENILQENAVSIVSCRSMALGKSACAEGNTKSIGESKTPRSVSEHRTLQPPAWGGRF